MPVTILERTLRRDGVETAAADNDDTLEVTWTIRFEQDVKSPQATFRILSEDGTLAYSMHTIIGDAWKDFAKGDETEVRVSFMPRFGGGGTFRLLLDVTDITGVHVLGADLNGPRVYVGPRPGTGGLGDAMASISMADLPMTDHRSLAFGGPKAALAATPEARNSDS
jgi:hypothetical protein